MNTYNLVETLAYFLRNPSSNEDDDWVELLQEANDWLAINKDIKPIGYITENALTSLKHPSTNYDLIYRESQEGLIPLYQEIY